MNEICISDDFVVDFVLEIFFYGIWKEVSVFTSEKEAFSFCPTSSHYRVIRRERVEKKFVLDLVFED